MTWILWQYICVPEMKFVGQRIQKLGLQLEQADTQTVATENITILHLLGVINDACAYDVFKLHQQN